VSKTEEKFTTMGYLVESGPSDAAGVAAFLNKKRSDGYRLVAVTGSANGHVFIFEATVK